ncbi:MAG: hypothetical protein ACKO2P_07150 [Planctomycetota bacterium]
MLQEANQQHAVKSRWWLPLLRNFLICVLAVTAVTSLPGCSLGVMMGKMLFGDPKLKCQFRGATGVDLTKGEKSILLACSAPHSVLARTPSIQIDIVDRMSRTLDIRGVRVISADDVAAWFDDHGEWGDFTELAERFDADYVMNISIDEFSLDVPDSKNLQQGKVAGKVQVLDCSGGGDPVTAFDRNFSLQFPEYPVPKENRSEQLFTESFLDRTSLTLAQFLYDHRASETVH